MPEYKRIIGAMHRLNILRKICIRDSAQGIDIHRAQMPILQYVTDHDGCTQAEISQFLHVSPASIACSAKRMESAGLIARAVDETNLRRNKLTATPAGRAHLARMHALFDEIDRRTFCGFSEEELEQFYSMLSRMIENASQDDTAKKSNFELLRQLDEKGEQMKC